MILGAVVSGDIRLRINLESALSVRSTTVLASDIVPNSLNGYDLSFLE